VPHLFLTQEAHAGVRIGHELACGGEVALERAKGAEALGQRLQPGILHRQVPKLLRTSRQLGCGEHAPDFFESFGHLLEALADGIFHQSDISGWARDSPVAYRL
jgi:hypothetical protein